MADAAASFGGLGAGAAADASGAGGGGGKSGGGGGGGDMSGAGSSDPFSGGGSMSDLAGGSSPFGFGGSPTSFGGDIAQTAQAAQDPTGTTGAQASIEQSQPQPGTPGGGIGGTQSGPVSLGQQAPIPAGGVGTPEAGAPVTTTSVPQQSFPTTPIPGNQNLTPAGGFSTGTGMGLTPPPTTTPATASVPSSPGWSGVSDRFGSWSTDPTTGASMPSSMAAGPDQAAAPMTPPSSPLQSLPQSQISQLLSPGLGDLAGGQTFANIDQPAGAGAAAGAQPSTPSVDDLGRPVDQSLSDTASNVEGKGDKLPAQTFDQRFAQETGDINLRNQLSKIAAQANPQVQPPQYPATPAQQPPAAPAEQQPPAKQPPAEQPPAKQPPAQRTAPRAAPPRAAPPVGRDPYGNTYTTQPGYQASPMSPLPPYPGPSPQTWPRTSAAPAPTSPATRAAMASPEGQAVQHAVNQLPTRTLLQLARIAGVPVPNSMALAMGGQPPPSAARPTAAPAPTTNGGTAPTGGPPRFSDMGQQLGREDIPTAPGPAMSPEQVMQQGDQPHFDIPKATPPGVMERAVRTIEAGEPSPRFEDLRPFSEKATQTGEPADFAGRFPPWMNDPNLADDVAAGKIDPREFDKPADYELAVALARQRAFGSGILDVIRNMRR